MATYVKPQSPPSSYAVAGVLDGEPGAWPRVFTGSAQRAVVIVPGLWLAGIRGRQLATGALYASATITTFLFVLYSLKKRR